MLCNYFWDETDPAKPFKYDNICNAYTVIPPNATRTPVPKYQKGTIPCWENDKWIVKKDWRQEKLYLKSTGEQTGYPTVNVDYDILEKEYTSIPPSSQYDKWVDDKWVVDVEAQTADNIKDLNNQRKVLKEEATEQIDIISDVIFYKEETGDDEDLDVYQSLYKAWRLYRGKITSMKIVTGKETFPDKPKKVDE